MYTYTMIFAILGRQSKLGLAELESFAGAAAVQPVGMHGALVDGALDGARLGSVTRLATPVRELRATHWPHIASELNNALPAILRAMPEGKIKLGISVFGVQVNERQLLATGLDLKKACRAAGRSVRVIPNTAPELNGAQVLRNQLTGDLGVELLLVSNGATTWLARTTWIQDVDAYAARDFGRPKRDAFVGMLPPKLAQTMLNLAGAQPGERILDPFCGTGVVLQEAALIGCAIYGTDISEKMIDYSRDNLAWLASLHGTPKPLLEIADATNHTWQPPLDHVVCETYLGQPLSGLPKPEKLQQITRDCNTIIEKFLKNLRPQLASGTRLCIAVPAWRVQTGFKHLALLDHLEDLGYNCVRFKYAGDRDMIYHRVDQIVARQLLVLISK